MLEPDLKRKVTGLLEDVSGCRAAPTWQGLGSGVGGSRWRLQLNDHCWFVKVVDEPARAVAEADGLAALGNCAAVKVPQVLAVIGTDTQACLVMEWLALGTHSKTAAAKLGSQLARQHRDSQACFGWPVANFIGSTPQFNTPDDDWIDFFREHRLGFQLRLAAENGYRGELQQQGARLLARLPAFFATYRPQPALLHGDLWGGNWGVLDDGEPVIFDPAVYYGDREADLAMTELFGGFPSEFYAAYDEQNPRDAGYRSRRDLYNLYHVLNHLNLFGDGYLSQALHSINRLLALHL